MESRDDKLVKLACGLLDSLQAAREEIQSLRKDEREARRVLFAAPTKDEASLYKERVVDAITRHTEAKAPKGLLLAGFDGTIQVRLTDGDPAEIDLLRGCELRLRAIVRDYGHLDGGWLPLLDEIRAKNKRDSHSTAEAA